MLSLLVDRATRETPEIPETSETPLLTREVIDEFLAPVAPGQALGWQVPGYAPPGSFTHSGFTGTWVLGVPSYGLTVALFTNRQHAGVGEDFRYPDLSDLQERVARLLLAAFDQS